MRQERKKQQFLRKTKKWEKKALSIISFYSEPSSEIAIVVPDPILPW